MVATSETKVRSIVSILVKVHGNNILEEKKFKPVFVEKIKEPVLKEKSINSIPEFLQEPVKEIDINLLKNKDSKIYYSLP